MSTWNPFAAIADIQRTVHAIDKKADQLMTQQNELDTDVQTIEAGVANLGTAATALQDQIAALKLANPTLDLTALDKAAADVTGAVSTIAAIATPPAS